MSQTVFCEAIIIFLIYFFIFLSLGQIVHLHTRQGKKKQRHGPQNMTCAQLWQYSYIIFIVFMVL
jgi:hypothetical protein